MAGEWGREGEFNYMLAILIRKDDLRVQLGTNVKNRHTEVVMRQGLVCNEVSVIIIELILMVIER